MAWKIGKIPYNTPDIAGYPAHTFAVTGIACVGRRVACLGEAEACGHNIRKGSPHDQFYLSQMR